MKTTFILLAAILLSGCSHCDDCESLRSKIPAQSVSGNYCATYTLYVDGEESFSSEESRLMIDSDNKNNAINGFYFQTYLYDGVNNPGKYKVIPEPGDLYRVWPINSLWIPVNGVPYDVTFGYDARYGSTYSARILFYGDDESTMFTDIKTVSDVIVNMKGWMKEKHYDHNSGDATFYCEITMDFTVEGVEYRIVITRT